MGGNPKKNLGMIVARRVQKELKKAADPTKAVDMQRYCKTTMPMYGIQKPERKRIETFVCDLIQQHQQQLDDDGDDGGESLKEDSLASTRRTQKDRKIAVPFYHDCIRSLWSMPHREEKYLAIDVALHYKDCITLESLDLYEEMLREEYMWWDLCDPIAINLVGSLVCHNMVHMKPILTQWIHDDNLWVRRAALLAQLKLKEETDEALLFDFCRQCMHEDEFFIRKAIGWVLREYGNTNPSAVISFLKQEKGHLSSLSYGEGSRILIDKGLMEK